MKNWQKNKFLIPTYFLDFYFLGKTTLQFETHIYDLI